MMSTTATIIQMTKAAVSFDFFYYLSAGTAGDTECLRYLE